MQKQVGMVNSSFGCTVICFPAKCGVICAEVYARGAWHGGSSWCTWKCVIAPSERRTLRLYAKEWGILEVFDRGDRTVSEGIQEGRVETRPSSL